MQRVRDVMTPDPVTVSSSASLHEAARLMRDNDIGDVVVVDDGTPVGILTDRDIVVRGLADTSDIEALTVGEMCSADIVTVSPDQPVAESAELMSRHAVRRLLVVEDRALVGVVSLGDVAIERDPGSVLGEISAAPPDA